MDKGGHSQQSGTAGSGCTPLWLEGQFQSGRKEGKREGRKRNGRLNCPSSDQSSEPRTDVKLLLLRPSDLPP